MSADRFCTPLVIGKIMISYAQSRKDFEFLESIAEMDDWAELQGDLHLLMQSPTQKKATEFYVRAIRLWFFEHGAKRKTPLTAKQKKIRDRYDAYVQ